MDGEGRKRAASEARTPFRRSRQVPQKGRVLTGGPVAEGKVGGGSKVLWGDLLENATFLRKEKGNSEGTRHGKIQKKKK